MRFADIIIGGTEKAGTTSVFSYLAQHPRVAVSKRKETNFFRNPHGRPLDYSLEFPLVNPETLLLEASPAYLGEASTVAPRIFAMLPNVKLLFILRDPVDRFVSSYYFHRERLNLPKNLSLHDYLSRCHARANMPATDETAPRDPARKELADWYLDVLPFGRYSDYLKHYFALFPRAQVQVAFYDDLRNNPRQFMQGLSSFLAIDARFWSTIGFERMNASFAGRYRWLHKIAVGTNDRLEPILRPRPRLKAGLLRLYKTINRGADADRTLAAEDRSLLEEYYATANRELAGLLGTSLPKGWTIAPP
ncbi:MAG: sulfotransferase domain-containing protein, partial [Woeseia sp.]